MKDDLYNRLTDGVVLQWLYSAKILSLSLVTGWIELCSRGIAIVCNDESTPLKFGAVNTGNEFYALYCWEDGIPGHSRAGRRSVPGNNENQCIFLRGFKITSRRFLKRAIQQLRL
jgi:hypothetical protein